MKTRPRKWIRVSLRNINYSQLRKRRPFREHVRYKYNCKLMVQEMQITHKYREFPNIRVAERNDQKEKPLMCLNDVLTIGNKRKGHKNTQVIRNCSIFYMYYVASRQTRAKKAGEQPDRQNGTSITPKRGLTIKVINEINEFYNHAINHVA